MGTAAAKLLKDPANKALATETFQKYDKDKSGKLDNDELRNFSADLLKGLGGAQPELKLSDLDPKLPSGITLKDAAKSDLKEFRQLRETVIFALTQGGHAFVTLDHFLSFDWSNLVEISREAAADEKLFRTASSLADLLKGDPSLASKAFDYVTREEESSQMSESLFQKFLADECVNCWQKEIKGAPFHELSDVEKRFWIESFYRVFTGSALAGHISREQWCAAPWKTLHQSILSQKTNLADFLVDYEGRYDVSGYGMKCTVVQSDYEFSPFLLVSIGGGKVQSAFIELRGYGGKKVSNSCNPVAKASKIQMSDVGCRIDFPASHFKILSSGTEEKEAQVAGDVSVELDWQAAMTDIEYSSKGKFLFVKCSVSLTVGGVPFVFETDKSKAKFVPKSGFTIFQYIDPKLTGWKGELFTYTRWDPLDGKWYTLEARDATLLPLLKKYRDLQ